MRRALRLTTAIYPAMGIVCLLGFAGSSRKAMAADWVADRVWPAIRYVHPPGSGTFFPGSFALNFFLPALAGMVFLNGALPSRFGALAGGRANIFYYLLVLVIAILEIGADTVLPLVALTGRWAFPLAITFLNAGFALSIALAAAASRGAGREW